MMHLKPMGDLGQIVPLRLSIRDELAVRAAVRESSVVINLVGEERETWNWRFKEVHAVFPTTLARICAETPSVERFVHVSSIAASATAPSWRERSRYEGEAGVLQHFPDATVIRLADVVGPEDRFFNRMATLIKGMPRVALVDGGRNRVQPVWVHDVVAGFRRILELESSKGKVCGDLQRDLSGVMAAGWARLELLSRSLRRHTSLLALPPTAWRSWSTRYRTSCGSLR